MNRYRAGRDFEYQVKRNLAANGYEIFRMAGSKTKVDLIAIKPGEALFVQCKRDGRIGPDERTELVRLARFIDATALLAYKPGVRQPLAYAKLIDATGDREEWHPDYGLSGSPM